MVAYVARTTTLLASFLLTFALLSSVWMLASGRPDPAPATLVPTATPSTAATPALTGAPTQSPRKSARNPTPTRPPTPTAAPTPTAPADPSPALAASPTLTPAGSPTQTQSFVVSGGAFISSDVPDGGSVVPSSDGVLLTTSATSSGTLSVTYQLDPQLLPPGARVRKVETTVCGNGRGQSWNVSGPSGTWPADYSSVPAGADGCWHFSGTAGSDASVIASTTLDSQLFIGKIVFTVTFGE